MKTFDPSTSYAKVATATPQVTVGDIPTNTKNILTVYKQAADRHVSMLVFPELSVTGYTLGDLLAAQSTIDQAHKALLKLAIATKNNPTAMIVGAPFEHCGVLYNCAFVLAKGKILGAVPKQNLPNYKEFYEKRWFQAWQKPANVAASIGKNTFTLGVDQLFTVNGTCYGVEICEDLWVANQSSVRLVNKGAEIICNLSASPELVAKASYRKQLIASTSARLQAGYIYSGADPSESTMDIVMGGHAVITELGRVLAQRKAFDTQAPRLTVANIDVQHIRLERRKDTNFVSEQPQNINTVNLPLPKEYSIATDKSPFIPKGSKTDIVERLDEILNIQAYGLKKRVEAAGINRIFLGLSGGLDSTLALLVAVRTADLLGLPRNKLIQTITMPGPASSGRTQSNAFKLATALGVSSREVPIGKLAAAELKSIGHDGATQDVTYENVQARLRTAILFNSANQARRGLVLGTGDLSEIALGWCTYNGDHMSGYNVNASVPKTLVRALVGHAGQQLGINTVQAILKDILDTPVSPELTRQGDGLSQETENIIGPYQLHDYFLYHFVRWLEPVDKIYWLACQAFDGDYSPTEIQKWLDLFMTRFYQNQWKRSAMPDGPKVGTVSLSPRGDWRMPSDITK